MRGVNLGGWLVLERWMTPSLFAGMAAADELTYCRQASKAQLTRLKRHRERYITAADFEWLAAHGIQAVRIPVGYWLFGDSAPFQPTVEYLDRAFRWAQASGIKVLISLHGAPGSQNGNDHSGCIGPAAWADDTRNVEHTLKIIRRLAERYQNSPALLGISLLNEPAVELPKSVLKDFYRQAYDQVRQICGPDSWVVISDGFRPRRWHLVLHRIRYRKVFLDTHQYFVFSRRHKQTPAARLERHIRVWSRLNLAWMRWHHPIIVGEWSAALDPGSLAGLDESQRQAAYHRHCRAQLAVYDQLDGWFYWSYKTEDMPQWSFRHCYQQGWFDDMLEVHGD